MSAAALPRLALVGAGCIGHRIAQALASREIAYTLSTVFDLDSAAAQELVSLCGHGSVATSLQAAASSADVLVECAAAAVVPAAIAAAQAEYAASGACAHVLVLSIGGLLQVPGLEGWPPQLAAGPVVHVPSGAIGGLDAIQALAVAGLDEVRLTTSKPPAGLGLQVTEQTLVFEGSARDVIARYPKNVNVAVALSFAGIGPDRTTVRLMADPGIDRNTHQILARGAAGEVEFTSRNVPFPQNPATSYLAALSAVSLLRKISSTLQVG